MFFYELLNMDTPILTEQQGLKYISSEQTLDDWEQMVRKSEGTPCYLTVVILCNQ